ncbi:hypothetical protein ZIOFF_047907 [Zingiber officinale]|uniref:Uncharacterized protein n=1 Tax=Zingiber officinale TaxID=94328 RepID=A0A8J5FY92_ZINOF|nr:hypothetical protein ZIOFF_047907 [Zingiber officinale]
MYSTSVLKDYHDLELSMATELMVLKDGDKAIALTIRCPSSMEHMILQALLSTGALDYKLPNQSGTDRVIYEMNVRAFTVDGSSGLDQKICGSHLGVTDEILHLLGLGINVVELSAADFAINFVTSRYASPSCGSFVASHQFKEMVKALHNAGIEVILDVVYNHTNEADDLADFIHCSASVHNPERYLRHREDGAEIRAREAAALGREMQRNGRRRDQTVAVGFKLGHVVGCRASPLLRVTAAAAERCNKRATVAAEPLLEKKIIQLSLKSSSQKSLTESTDFPQMESKCVCGGELGKRALGIGR